MNQKKGITPYEFVLSNIYKQNIKKKVHVPHCSPKKQILAVTNLMNKTNQLYMRKLLKRKKIKDQYM